VARPELGTKRVCPTTGRKFYDLNKDPIISPYTGQVVTIAAPLLARGVRPDTAAPRAAQTDEDNDIDPATDAELISLEEADDEASAAKSVVGDDDIDVEDDNSTDDDTFLEEDEDENDDVTDLIGDGIEDDEEA
jgi:uncharacterized protein (TIGR02300 family)